MIWHRIFHNVHSYISISSAKRWVCTCGKQWEARYKVDKAD